MVPACDMVPTGGRGAVLPEGTVPPTEGTVSPTVVSSSVSVKPVAGCFRGARADSPTSRRCCSSRRCFPRCASLCSADPWACPPPSCPAAFDCSSECCEARSTVPWPQPQSVSAWSTSPHTRWPCSWPRRAAMLSKSDVCSPSNEPMRLMLVRCAAPRRSAAPSSRKAPAGEEAADVTRPPKQTTKLGGLRPRLPVRTSPRALTA